MRVIFMGTCTDPTIYKKEHKQNLNALKLNINRRKYWKHVMNINSTTPFRNAHVSDRGDTWLKWIENRDLDEETKDFLSSMADLWQNKSKRPFQNMDFIDAIENIQQTHGVSD